jgi:MoaA/NifB/PqqE/SkfB family radical SAM enzyme
MRQWWRVRSAGNDPGTANDYCPFVESGSTAIAWHGRVSPCLPLMHTHTTYLDEREHLSRCYVAGTIMEHSLAEIWNDPEYVAFRERVQKFDFAPCLSCGSCEMFDKNEEDCFGNTFPTCGGCLWAQGLIQCP